MRKKIIGILICLFCMVSFYYLAGEAAVVVSRATEKCVLIDAGHGGADPGMVGIGGLEEKGINLEIAVKLQACLEEKGYRVIMTRQKDQGLYEENSRNKKAQDLQNRCNQIAREKPDISVSIHQNSYSDSSVKGPQVFYYTDSKEGEKLAQKLQEQLNQQLEVENPRQIKGNSSYYLLKRSEGILCIVECGFLTNETEAQLLQTKEYQDKVARAIAQGIQEYFSDV